MGLILGPVAVSLSMKGWTSVHHWSYVLRSLATISGWSLMRFLRSPASVVRSYSSLLFTRV